VKVDSTSSQSSRSLTSASAGAGAARSQQGAAATAGAPAGAAGASSGDATVNLSGLSGQLRTSAASGNADIDVGLVQSIKDALNNGTLSIDANKIADGVLNTARELLQQQRPKGG
jgi:negative regulator of flagellin synthesis FlgM